MDVLSACDVSLSGSLDVRYDLKQSCANQIQHCNNNMNATTEDHVMEKLGNALTRILRVHDAQLQLLSRCSSHLECNAVGDRDVDVIQSEKSNTEGQESSNSSNPASLDIKDEVTDMSSDTKSYLNLETLDGKQPMTPTASKKLVSAMKGAREALGLPKKKLTVTWDPEVYDPPVTSVSHSVKSHNSHNRSRSKKSSKHKHKGKSSQGSSSSSSSSSSSKRYPKHAGKSDSRSKSYMPLERLPFADYNQSSSKELDINVTDMKCSSTYLGASLPMVQIPVAEAT